MLGIIADRGNSWIFNIADEPEIDMSTLESQFSKRYLGWLVNGKGITELVMQMPVSKFAIKDGEGKVREITREQAESLYQMMEEYALNKQRKGIPKK